MRRTSRAEGFTLVELLVAIAVLSVGISLALGVFSNQRRTHEGIKGAIHVQQDVRLVADAIIGDLRMAGYMVPRQAAMASVDGNTNGTDMICVSDPDKIADAEASAAINRFDMASTTAQINGGASSATLATTDTDVDGDGDDDFVVGEGVIIVDDDSSHCGLITGISGAGNNVVAFTPDTPSGFNAAPGSTRVVPAIIYWVSGTDLLRNSLRVASWIEDLQIEFGVDSDGNGLIASSEFEHDLNGDDPLDTLSVRLSVIARADRAHVSTNQANRPAAANRVAGSDDGIRRRRVTTTVTPRNIQAGDL